MIPSAFDLAYIAGFVDGEGYFGLIKRRDATYRPTVTVVQKKPKVCYWLQEIFGFGGVFMDTDGTSRWRNFNREDIVVFINFIEPYLKIKLREARMLKFFCRLPLYSHKPLIRKCREVLYKEIRCEKRFMDSPFAGSCW